MYMYVSDMNLYSIMDNLSIPIFYHNDHTVVVVVVVVVVVDVMVVPVSTSMRFCLGLV